MKRSRLKLSLECRRSSPRWKRACNDSTSVEVLSVPKNRPNLVASPKAETSQMVPSSPLQATDSTLILPPTNDKTLFNHLSEVQASPSSSALHTTNKPNAGEGTDGRYGNDTFRAGGSKAASTTSSSQVVFSPHVPPTSLPIHTMKNKPTAIDNECSPTPPPPTSSGSSQVSPFNTALPPALPLQSSESPLLRNGLHTEHQPTASEDVHGSDEFWSKVSEYAFDALTDTDRPTVRRNVVKKQTSLLSFMASKSPKPNGLAVSLSGFRVHDARASKISDGAAKAEPVMADTKRRNSTAKTCPFYKKIPGTSFTVDAFRYGSISGCQAYFLTHFHADHYGGLKRSFQHPIYCSKVTGNLVQQQLKVSGQCVHSMPLDKPFLMDSVEITFLDANHGTAIHNHQATGVEGSVLILFRLKSGLNYLHTGDFRFTPSMLQYPPLVDLTVHQLYLDTTYCDPRYDFPPQEHVIAFAVEKSLEAVRSCPNTLIVCGTYTIGKEKVFMAIARVLGVKICVTREKKAVLLGLEDPSLSELLTTDWNESCLHVMPMAKLNLRDLPEYYNGWSLQYSQVIAFKPTGWSHTGKAASLSSIQPQVRGAIRVYGIPYSEHSSYEELRGCVQALRPLKIVPTVNNFSAQKRDDMQRTFQKWLAEKNGT